MSTDKPSVIEALSLVMGDVQAVKKTGHNAAQNFNFRGIDAVINAVGPALRKHGVVAVPTGVVPAFESYQSRNGALMRNCVLTITWRFYGPAGDFIEAQSLGEASDSGDKSAPKAHSVAYRTLLLQALCIPTDEPDPDETVHERALPSPPDPRAVLRADIARLGAGKGWSVQVIGDDFAQWSKGVTIPAADEALLEKYIAYLGEAVTRTSDPDSAGYDPMGLDGGDK